MSFRSIVLAPSFAAHPALRLRLHPVHGLSCRSPTRRSCRSSDWVGFGELRQAVGAAATGDVRSCNLAIFGSLYIVICIVLGPGPGDPARPEDPRRGRAPPDLSLSDGALLHRHRHGLEMVPRSRHRPRARRADLGLGELLLHAGSRTATWRSTPSSSPRSGSPPASSWRCSSPACAASTTRSSRPRRSTAPRPFTIYRRIIIPHAAAGLPVGLRRARAPRHQVLRPGHRADRRRPRPRRPSCRRPSCTPTPSRRNSDGHRRRVRDHHADDDRRRSSFPTSIPSCGRGSAR